MTHHNIQILTSEGDETLEWQTDDPVDVARARELFYHYSEKGYLAYHRYDGCKGDGVLLKEFDPNIKKIIMVPPVTGG